MVPGGGHVVLVSIAHSPHFRLAVENQGVLFEELINYKNGLQRMYQHYGANMITFEIVLNGPMHHAHIQIVPIPVKYELGGIKNMFLEEAEKSGFSLKESSSSEVPPYNLKIELPGDKILYHHAEEKPKFGTQWTRKVLAVLLGTPERDDWRSCQIDEEKEREDRNKFLEAFKEYDFTLKI